LAIVIIVFAGIFFYANRNGASQAEKALKPGERIWIEVLAKAVSIRHGDELTGLKTGDALGANETIVVSHEGLANIHFPDGSVARVDADTELTLEEAECGSGDGGSLKVRVFLKMGRFWSKIIKLSTPESFWEVKTSNAVAAVRGTAFGVEYTQGRTMIIGSQNEVAVTAIDPQNGQPLVGSTAVVGPDKVLEIFDADIADFKSGKKSLANLVGPAPTAVLKSRWVERAKNQDALIDGKVQTLRDGGLTETDIQSALRSENEKELYNKAPEVFEEANSSDTVDDGSLDAAAEDPFEGGGTVDNGDVAPAEDASSTDDILDPNAVGGPVDEINLLDQSATDTDIVAPVLQTPVLNANISPIVNPPVTNILPTAR